MSTQPSPEQLPKRAAKKKQISRQRVYQYFGILFSAALLLLLFAFMIERRQNALFMQQSQEKLDILQEKSVSAVQSLQNLYEENDRLKQELDVARDQQSAQQAQIAALTDELEKSAAQLANVEHAMDWFWQVNEAYANGKYALCRSLIAHLEDDTQGTPLKNYLPTDSYTNNQRFSPAARYEEIYAALF